MDSETRIRDQVTLEIPDITLGRELGKGGMAVVYEGSDLDFRPPRRVAVKVMNTALHDDGAYRARFEREAATIASFRHENIVRVYASKETGTAKYIIMEFLPGGTLAEHLRKGPMEVTAAVRTASTLADALAYSHERSVVHRDFKPANVMFTAEGKPVLTDFGVAKPLASDRTEFTRVAQIIGTPRYMSPEQEEGSEITDRADVYSFGLVFHEMLTGRLPTVRAIRTEEDLLAARASLRALDPHYADLICDCLRWDPQRRPTAAECRDRLNLIHPASRTQLWLAGGVAGVLAVGIAVGAIYWGEMQQSAITEVAQSPASPPPKVPTEVAQAPSVTPIGTAPIVTMPIDAAIYVDGQQVSDRRLPRDAGEHELAVVFPGYVGRLLTARGDALQPIVLQPLDKPTLAEHSSFVEQFFANPANDAAVRTIPSVPVVHAPLRELLALKTLRDRGADAELRAEARKILELANRGDAAARLVAFVAADQNLIAVDKAAALADLKSAMEQGYALASFYYAMHLDGQYDPTQERSRAVTQDVLAALDLAERQGLTDMATEYRDAIKKAQRSRL